MEAGINPEIPQLVDTNAIVKIFRQQGAPSGFFATLFFLIPVLLSNLKILGSKNKLVNNLLFWVGLLIFDILVSFMVAFNIDEMKSLLVGRESKLKIGEVLLLGEFWLIFVFGMLPLIISHYLITYISNAYKESQRDIVDAEKNKKIQYLDEEMIDFVADKEILTNKVKEKDDVISENNKNALNLEIEMNNLQNQIENNYAELQRQIKAIYDDFSARIISGIIFTDVILDSVISAYKSGFIEFLPKYYAADEVARRVQEIELATEITI
jgi:hypothetical protein